MVSRIVGAALLAAVAVMPVQPVAAQRPLGGAIGGGITGGVIGGALGGSRGAAIGAIVGAGTGAAIASQGRRFRHGYRGWHDGVLPATAGRPVDAGASAPLPLVKARRIAAR